MALEDFVSQDEESQVDLRPIQHRIDFTDPENEDLFDFEDQTVLPDGTSHRTPVISEADLAIEAAAQHATPSPAPSATSPSDTSTDDEDLLEFEERNEAPAAGSTAPDAPAPVAPEAAATPQADASAGEDLLDEIAPETAAVEKPGVEVTPQAQQEVSAVAEDAGPAPEDAPTVAAPRAELSPARAPGRRVAYTEDELPSLVLPGKADLPRLGISLPAALIGCFLALNLALVLFAWRTSTSFENTMTTITEAVENAALEGRTIAELATPSQPQQGPGSTGAAGPNGFELEPLQVPSAVENFHELSLKIARQHLEGGSYAEARLTLNHMLANKARADVSPELQAEAEFMIAESYHMQAKALPAGGDEPAALAREQAEEVQR